MSRKTMELKISHAQYTGTSHGQEDSYRIFDFDNGKVIAIFDGHGNEGDSVSNLAGNAFQNKLRKEYVRCMFTDTDKQIFQRFGLESGGTTVTMIVIIYSLKKILCANVGDSEAMIVKPNKSFKIMTANHAPENIEEYQRMIKDGTKVRIIAKKRSSDDVNVFDGAKFSDRYLREMKVGHIIHSTVRKDPLTYVVERNRNCLAMTRALGDFLFASVNVINEPDINVYNLESCRIILASDGFWDLHLYENVANFEEDADDILSDTKIIAHKNRDYDDCTIIVCDIKL